MKTVLTVALAGGWTLSSEGGAYTIERRETCVDGACAPTGTARIREDGVWVFASGLEVQWRTPTAARMRHGEGPWVPATLAATFAGPPPWEGEAGRSLSPGWAHGVLPGLWFQDTWHCEAGTVAWLFQPIVAEQKELIVRKVDSGWTFTEGGHIVKCVGDIGGITERTK